MRYFNYEEIAEDAGISRDDLAALAQLARDEFPDDETMAQMHFVRTCMAIRNGEITVEAALQPY